MTKSRNLPENAIHIQAYADLQNYARAFAEGHLNFLMLLGPPGTGKSRCFQDAMGQNVCWIDGNATAFGIYVHAHENRDHPIVLDDVDGLYRDRNGVRLLKSLCQSETLKTLSWCSDSRTLEKRQIPKRFTTTSRVAIIANEWRTLNCDVLALEDRGHVIYFDPPPVEVHRRAGIWFWDQEIFDFVGEHLHHFVQHSLRTYRLAWEQKRAGLDWRNVVLNRCLSGNTLVVARLKSNPKYATEEERAKAFVEGGHGSRSTYFNHAKKLPSRRPVPKITLTSDVPSDTAREDGSSMLDLLRERFGDLGSG
ncbi:MAG: hypothetical protein ABIP48_17785 [Planctomycetota bacterium]